jgi:anti-anti-sigma factor
MSLMIDMVKEGFQITLYVKGVLDISTTKILDQTLEEIGNIDQLVVDLEGLEFIDSTGVGSIINAIRLSEKQKCKLKLQGMNQMIHDIFDTLGVYYILETVQKEIV